MNLRQIKKYFKVYFLFTRAAFNQMMLTRFSSFIFMIGKILRFLFSLLLIFLIIGKSKGIVGYTIPQAVVFFLVFNLVDVVVQTLFRGVYWFRGTIVKGNFDYYLLKPLNPLFRSLFCYTDFLDIVTLIPLFGYTLFYLSQNNIIPGVYEWLSFLLLFVNAVFFSFSIHILILGIGILSTEIDHTIWIYRDFIGMLRLPIEIYNEPLRVFFTFILPVVVMTNFPAKALLGLLSGKWIFYSLAISGVFFLFSLKFWHYALTKYTSASS